MTQEGLLRRGALWAGVPLSLSLLVPYPLEGGWAMSWQIARELEVQAMLVAPLAGIAMVAAVLVPRIPRFLRAIVVTIAGAVGLWSVRAALLHPEIVVELDREIGELRLAAVQALVGAILLAAARELAMQRRKASRGLAALAFLGWLHLAARCFFPLHGDDIDGAPFILATEAMDRGGEDLLLGAPILIVLVFVVLCAVLALRKVFGTEETRVARRFRTAWTTVFVAGLFGVGLGAILAVVSIAEEELALTAVSYHAFAILFGVPVGLAWGLGHAVAWLPDTIADARSTDAARRRTARATLGLISVAIAALVVWRAIVAFGPDPRDAAIAALAHRVSETVTAAAMGKPYDESLHGGYPESDLRASLGVLREHVPDGASVEPVAFAFDLASWSERAFRARIVVTGGDARWSTLERAESAGASWRLDLVDEGLVSAFERSVFALGRGECVRTIEGSDLPEPAARALELSAEPAVACGRGAGDRIRDAGRSAAWGHIERHVTVVRAGDRFFALRGTWYADQGRLWLGPVTVEVL